MKSPGRQGYGEDRAFPVILDSSVWQLHAQLNEIGIMKVIFSDKEPQTQLLTVSAANQAACLGVKSSVWLIR